MTYKRIFQKIIFPLAELISGTTILKKQAFLEKSQYWSEKEIEDYQNKRLRQLIIHAYNNVKYYRKLFDSLGIKPSDIKTKKDLKKLPILTKKIIQKNHDDLRANYTKKSFATFTSGSTGSPTKFFQTKEDFSWIWAAHFRKWVWANCEIGDKYVKISLNNTRVKLSKKIQDMLFRCMYIYAIKMDNNSVQEYIEKIRSYNPDLIYGYSSALTIFAEYMKKNNISLKIKAVITTGDNLMPKSRKMIEEVFKCKVYDEYGCGGEGLLIASQCDEQAYHINDELMITEIISNNIIVTSLNNYEMPLIRYAPDDLVTRGKKCVCGRNLRTLKSIDGRSKDIVITPKGGKLLVHFFTVLFEHMKGISQFKIIQKEKNGIIIKLVITEVYNKKIDEEKIKREIHKSTDKSFRVKFSYKNKIPKEKNGKYKIIENKLK
jgi:phenylacetate-CoA ligase